MVSIFLCVCWGTKEIGYFLDVPLDTKNPSYLDWFASKILNIGYSRYIGLENFISNYYYQRNIEHILQISYVNIEV